MLLRIKSSVDMKTIQYMDFVKMEVYDITYFQRTIVLYLVQNVVVLI